MIAPLIRQPGAARALTRVADPHAAASDAAIAAVAERDAAARGDGRRRVVRIERRPSPYRTSFPLEEVDVLLDDGSLLALLLKDLTPARLTRAARRAKPRFLLSPAREIEVYRRFLDPVRWGTTRCYAAFAGPPGEGGWLLLERVRGTELYQHGDLETWKAAARWLAGFHRAMARRVDLEQAAAARLLIHDAAWYRRWLLRARRLLPRDTRARPALAPATITWLLARYRRAIDRLCALPATLTHGEFYASNVLLGDDGRRVCPVDWEMAALAPGLLDLAALVSGTWMDEERRALVDAYRSAWSDTGGGARVDADSGARVDADGGARVDGNGGARVDADGEARVDAAGGVAGEALRCCRLHIALQWLAWSGDWRPPPEHRCDWLGEALRLAEEME